MYNYDILQCFKTDVMITKPFITPLSFLKTTLSIVNLRKIDAELSTLSWYFHVEYVFVYFVT